MRILIAVKRCFKHEDWASVACAVAGTLPPGCRLEAGMSKVVI